MTNIPTNNPSLCKWAGLENDMTLPETSQLLIDPTYDDHLTR